MHKSLSAIFGLGMASALAAVAPAQAEEGVAIKNLLGQVGLIPREKDPIHYRERAPLVIPPKAALPLPTPSERYASSNPDWPTDPDVAAKRRRADEERRPVTWSETRRMSENNPMLSAAEMQKGRIANAPQMTAGGHRGDNARDVLLANPDGARQAEVETPIVNGEPVRKDLTDPPTGMRRIASRGKAAVDYQPRIDQQQADANPINWLTRKFKGGDDDE